MSAGPAAGAWWRALRGWVAFGAVLVVVAGGIVAATRGGSTPQRHLTAMFASAPGLYAGNQVKVLGIPEGRITSVRATASGAVVDFEVPARLPIPAGVQVLLEAPELISDRYLQLTPAYNGGPTLGDHAVIPATRTFAPVSVDQIFDSLDRLAVALGPAGANAHGALSALLHSTATAFAGDGPALKDTISHLGGALGALSSQGPALTSLLDSVGHLTKVAAGSLTTYRSFSTDIQAVSGELAADDADIATALSTLQQALAQLASFVAEDRGAITGSVANLQGFAHAVAGQVTSLEEAFAVLPQALQNLKNAYNPNAPGGPAITARFDPTAGSAAFDSRLCGNYLLRLLTVALATPSQPDTKPADDLICGLNGVVAQLPVPPGASAGPDLSIASLLGGPR